MDFDHSVLPDRAPDAAAWTDRDLLSALESSLDEPTRVTVAAEIAYRLRVRDERSAVYADVARSLLQGLRSSFGLVQARLEEAEAHLTEARLLLNNRKREHDVGHRLGVLFVSLNRSIGEIDDAVARSESVRDDLDANQAAYFARPLTDRP